MWLAIGAVQAPNRTCTRWAASARPIRCYPGQTARERAVGIVTRHVGVKAPGCIAPAGSPADSATPAGSAHPAKRAERDDAVPYRSEPPVDGMASRQEAENRRCAITHLAQATKDPFV